MAGGERCGLRFLDATSLTSNVQEGDWIVTRAAEDERHLWRIVEASGLNERRDVVPVPRNRESAPPLFAGAHDEQREAIYYSRIVPAKYYLDVLGLVPAEPVCRQLTDDGQWKGKDQRQPVERQGEQIVCRNYRKSAQQPSEPPEPAGRNLWLRGGYVLQADGA